MDKEKIKDITKSIFIIAGIVLFVYFCYIHDNSNEPMPEHEPTTQEEFEYKLQELKNRNEEYEDKIGHLKSYIEDLEKENEEKQDLINILREQLESYGIEPDDL